jgi:hypothetical protein
MEIGEDFRIKFPFYLGTHHGYDAGGDYYCDEVWIPGTKSQDVCPDDCELVADGEGEMILSIVDIHKPGRYPERVFYTRKWIDPDGDEFGATKLRIITTPTFKRRAAGYYHEYRVL